MGHIARWFGISTDIDDLKRANEELERRVTERTSELTTAVREMEGFTYSVSHDLRGPLRAILATSRILVAEAGAGLNDEMRDLLDRQQKAASRLGALIDALLRLSRISRAEMTRTDVDLTEIARSVEIDICGQDWPVPPNFTIQDGMACLGDDRLLRLVLHNLMENAVKFSPSGAQVEVGQTDEGVFFVRDHGVGFEMRYAEKLWIPFERLVRDEEFPGTGIGLANVKRIVERHGGAVWAESAPGEGSTFYFTIQASEVGADQLGSLMPSEAR
jgi:light-regulated signal transduction histidine kinase (bacteriophytochrome)